MKPDRSNYEIWFTDWLDGNLNQKQIEEFIVFVNENPDLREELNGLSMVSLEPNEVVFKRKESIKRSSENISDSQFDNLCIASLENDLTPEQQSELNYIIEHSEIKRKNFELVRKLKLKPSTALFKRKSSVKKLTAGQRILKLSAIGLSAAATVAIMILAYLFLAPDVKMGTQQTARNQITDTFLLELHPAIIDKGSIEFSVRSEFLSVNKTIILESGDTGLKFSPVNHGEQENITLSDSLPVFYRQLPPDYMTVKMPESILNTFSPDANALQAFNPDNLIKFEAEDRSNVDRFLARFFHETLMRDTISGDRPVESYELAIAGITGLNKLLGWEMALQKNTDENGEIRSYYFSSKLLKFNAPVKKEGNEL
jgi:uncharacterized protein YbcI